MKPHLSLAVIVVALSLAPIAHAAETGDRYLLADGTLSPEVSGSATQCLALAATSQATVSRTFVGPLTNQSLNVTSAATNLHVEFAPGATAGTGFTLRAVLTLPGETGMEQTKTYGAGASVDSPATLTFDTPQRLGSGDVTLELTLSKAGAVPLGQDVAALCNTQASRLGSILFQDPVAVPTEEEPDEHGHGDGLSLPLVLLISLGAGFITLVAGAFVLAGRTISQRRIHFLLGATAGLLLAIAILDLLPEALELSETAPYTIIVALLVLFGVRHFAGDHGHDHGAGHGEPGHEHTHAEKRTHAGHLALVAFFALGFHRFVDGVVLPAAFELDNAVGLAAAGAVLVHQFPDGIAAASLFLAAGWRRKKVLVGIAVMAALTPIGSLLGVTLLGEGELVGHLIGLAAATFIFIALAELLPELRAREHRLPVGVGFAAGYAVALMIVIIPALLGVQH